MCVPLKLHTNSYFKVAQIALGAWKLGSVVQAGVAGRCYWLLFHQDALEAGTLLMSYN